MLRSEALSCHQKMVETFYSFSLKVRGAVTDCEFVVPCAHATQGLRCTRADCRGVNYTNSVIRDILLSGIYDVEIHCKVLSNIICTVEGKESARNAVAVSAPRQPAEAAAASFKSQGKPANCGQAPSTPCNPAPAVT